MTLGERIALARKRAGLSQEQLGEKLGVSRQAVSKWESDQTNPDVAYVAQMCRLLEVSSDWLLLGEESAQGAPAARCPDCQAIVSGLDQYCPACGRSLQKSAALPDGYLLLLRLPKDGAFSPTEDLVRLSKTGLFLEDSPLHTLLSWEEAEALAASAPVVLARGLSEGQVQTIRDKVYNPALFSFFQNCDGEDPQVLASWPGTSFKKPPRPRQPLSFGRVILAVILGVMGAFLLLPILINLIAAFLGPLL